MTRLFKLLALAGLSSVYLMQTPCSITGNGFSVIPNIGKLIAIPKIF